MTALYKCSWPKCARQALHCDPPLTSSAVHFRPCEIPCETVLAVQHDPVIVQYHRSHGMSCTEGSSKPRSLLPEGTEVSVEVLFTSPAKPETHRRKRAAKRPSPSDADRHAAASPAAADGTAHSADHKPQKRSKPRAVAGSVTPAKTTPPSTTPAKSTLKESTPSKRTPAR